MASPAHDKATRSLDDVHPRNLAAGTVTQPRESGIAAKPAQIDHGRAVGQALDWAMDRCHLTRQRVTIELGYQPDSNVISRWCSGVERPQLDKLREKLPELYLEFLLALLQTEEGVEVKTTVTMKRAG